MTKSVHLRLLLRSLGSLLGSQDGLHSCPLKRGSCAAHLGAILGAFYSTLKAILGSKVSVYAHFYNSIPKISPRCPKMAQRAPQDGQKWIQDRPQMPQESPKRASRSPKWAQDRPKLRPRWTPNRIKIDLQSSWNIEAEKGSALLNFSDPFWTHVGPSWKPKKRLKAILTSS